MCVNRMILLMAFVCWGVMLSAQQVYTIKADSVKLTGCDSTELIIENHTQGVKGFLFNTGNGRTVFKRGLIKVSDSMYVIGGDTLRSNPWVQGGNNFGTTGVLGTKDNNHLDLYTNNLQRARVTNAGNVVIGGTSDNGKKLQVNGTLSVSDTSFLSGLTLTYNDSNTTIKGAAGRSVLIGSAGVNNNGPSGFNNHSTGSVVIHAPAGPLAGIGGSIYRCVVIGGSTQGSTGIVSNSLVIAKDIGFDPLYNGSLMRSNILALGGSSGLLRDDNPGGATYMLANFTGNIYLGYTWANWAALADLPSGYIQIGGSQHNLMALFGGFHATAPIQSTFAGPSFRNGALNQTFGTGYFRVAAGRATGTGKGSDLRLAVAPPGSSGTTLNPYVDVISISGATSNVGIGVTSPTAQLHTTGTVRFAGLTNDSTQTRVLVSDGSGNVYYRSAASLATNDMLHSSLAVNGPIKARSLTLSQSGWPDYVFDSAYHLLSLTEVEKYVRENNHLPGVPSAGVVEKEGVSVGEVQAALLKKIEELTLYNIQQEKKIERLQTRLDERDAEVLRQKELIENIIKKIQLIEKHQK